MKNEKFTPSDELIDTLYLDFTNDKTILSISALRRKHGFGSKSGDKIRLAIYAKHGKDAVQLEVHRRVGKYRRTKITGTYKNTEESNEKRRSSYRKTYWSRPDLQANAVANGKMTFGRKKTPEQILKTSSKNTGKKRTDEQRKHSSDGQPNKGKSMPEYHRKALCVPKSVIPPSYIRSEETKKKLSDICKKQWLDGIHKATFISKGQNQLFDTLKSLGHTVKLEHIIDGRPFDVWIVGTKTVFEFNGTYWHRDPRKYASAPDVEAVWENDREKLDIAKNNGYSVIVVWQKDWELSDNKMEFTANLLKQNGY